MCLPDPLSRSRPKNLLEELLLMVTGIILLLLLLLMMMMMIVLLMMMVMMVAAIVPLLLTMVMMVKVFHQLVDLLGHMGAKPLHLMQLTSANPGHCMQRLWL
jgi:hypothetical protein